MSKKTPTSATASVQTIDPLIQTKLALPQPRIRLVSRPRLLNILTEGLRRSLTLICAPAGYGKTTLLTDGIAGFENEPGCPMVCWLSLDGGDNEPNRFLSYLAAAFANVNPAINSQIGALLGAIPPQPFQSILGVLINELLKSDRTILLVLDDYQFISNSVIHAGLAFFLDHQPMNVHLVMLTRSDPPIALARLRARDQLMEVRAADLKFTSDEATQFMNQIMTLGLTDAEILCLLDRTEGWAAGLQMASLALTSQSNRALFVKNFSGTNRYILDFLVEEILSHQSETIQSFLIRTSILDNLSGPLCDAVVHDSESNGNGSSQEILEYLERANLFLVSLDSERRWYRYHHLFADLLRARLEQKSPGLVAQLHLRASEWYERNGQMPEAINHALAARAYDPAGHLIETLVEQLVAKNGMRPLLGWINQLPTEITLSHPWLCIALAWSNWFTSSVEKIEPLLRTAEENIHGNDPTGLQSGWRGHIACLRACVAGTQSDLPRTIEMSNLALTLLRPEDSASRTFAAHMLGRALFMRGDFSPASETLMGNVHECIRAEGTNIIAPTLSALSKIYRIEGRLREAIELVKVGQVYIERCDPRRVTVAGVAFIGQADVLREWNQLEVAEELAQRSVDLCSAWVNPTSTCGCYTILARIHLAQGKFSAAETELRVAEESIRDRNPLPEATSDLNTALVRFWLATGQASKTSQWLQGQTRRYDQHAAFSILKERDEITIVRALIAEGKLEDSLSSLDHLAKAAEVGKRYGHLIEIQNLQALAHRARGHSSQALNLLEKSLALSEPEKYIRIYVDENEAMQELLQAYIRSPSNPTHKSYARKLLAAFTGSGQAILPEFRKTDLIEPLTSREREVLQLLTNGLTNREIAETLFLSEGTIKFHVHHVLKKLQARTRSQAIVIARKQNLI